MTTKTNFSFGSGWMIIAAFLFASMSILVKYAASKFAMTAYELAFWRSLLPALILYVGIAQRRQSLKTPYFWGHIHRSAAGTVAMFLAFYGLSHLPLATAITLNYTSVVFIALLSIFGLQARPTAIDWLSSLMGLLGIGMILQPAFFSEYLLDTLITLSGGVFTAIAILQVRKLSHMGEPAWRIVFYFSSVAALMSAVATTIDGWQALTLQSLPYIMGIGITGLLAQLAMTHAYHVGQKFTVASLSYLTVVFSALYGVIFLAEPIGAIEIFGIVAVILAGIVSALPKKAYNF